MTIIMMRIRSFSYLLLALVVVSCGGGKKDEPAQETITVKGSDTMVQLGQRWAENYMKADSSLRIQVTGGGSGTGISALINGTTDICMASRPMKDKEKEQLQQKYQSAGVEITVARDGLTIFLNKANPVAELTMEQIKGIYTGKIKNWKEVGGSDAKIILYGRENSSGTYVFFKEHALNNEDFANEMQALPGTAAVVNAVKSDPNGIGFGGVGYAEDLKEAAIRKDATAPALLPKKENIDNNSYPLSRSLYFYMRKAPEGKAKAFVDWVLSPAGQEVVSKEGFFPVR
jgi:phosphate transport system substrate-binding protein